MLFEGTVRENIAKGRSSESSSSSCSGEKKNARCNGTDEQQRRPLLTVQEAMLARAADSFSRRSKSASAAATAVATDIEAVPATEDAGLMSTIVVSGTK